MSRRLTVAALALAVAGGVYMTGGPAEASNMGFKLERDFAAIGPPANARVFRGIYYVSGPLFNGLADIADSSGGGPMGPCTGTGDGVVNAADAGCDWWTSRQGTMIIERFISDNCSFESYGLTYDPLFMTVVANGSPFVLQNPGTQIDDDGYRVIVPFEGTPLSNQAVIVGSHDPSYAGFTLAIPPSNCRPNRPIINLPYHTMYTQSDEILCGLEGSAWVDVVNNSDGSAGADGSPDTCPSGIYPDLNSVPPGSGSQVILETFDNVADSSPDDNSYISRAVTFDTLFNVLVFSGARYNLTPGDAYHVTLDHDLSPPEHTPTVFLSPHF